MLKVCDPIVVYHTYYHYEAKTGDRLRYAVMDETDFYNNIGCINPHCNKVVLVNSNKNPKFFTKNGEPRNTIIIKGKKFYKE